MQVSEKTVIKTLLCIRYVCTVTLKQTIYHKIRGTTVGNSRKLCYTVKSYIHSMKRGS